MRTRARDRWLGMSAAFIVGQHPVRGQLYAAIDPRAHHVEGQIAERKFPAFLTPFRTVEEAEAALIAAGAELGRRAASAGARR